jgi:uncharacterized membrane protein YphA (DoxX/SURF4 family)
LSRLTALGRLEKFWFTDFDPVVLVPMRVLIGLSLAGHYVATLNEFDLIYHPAGVINYINKGVQIPVFLLTVIYGAAIAGGILFAIGAYTRTSGFAALVAHFYLVVVIGFSNAGWAPMMIPTLMLCLIANCGARWSYDSYRRFKSDISEPELARGWAVRLLQILFCTIYWGAVLHRLDDPAWHQGYMVFFILDHSSFTRFPLVDLYEFIDFFKIAAWATILAEIILPVTVWFDKTYKISIIAIVLLHSTIELSTTTGRWQTLMMGFAFLFGNRLKR